MRKKLAQANLPVSSRIAIFLAVSAILCAAILCGTERAPTKAPRFSDYPFDQWSATPEHSAIKWDVHILPAQLSVHQRLIQRIQATVPGGELAKRRGRGELVLLYRFEDSDGRQWRSGTRLSLVDVQPGVKSEEITFTVVAFIKPGEYKFSVALVDSETMDHSFATRTVHVAPLKADPLPAAWNGLPSIEILPAVDGPDSWFLPAVKDLLHLPLAGRIESTEPAFNAPAQTVAFLEKPVVIRRMPALPADAPRIDLLINATPSEWANNQASTQRRNMAVVIPALKVLSALNAKVRPPSAAVMDLTRQRVGFEAANAAALDWNALQKVLSGANPGIIDARSLSTQSSVRGYFANEVARRALDSGPERWLIVMSGPLVFSHQEETPLRELPPDPRRHIVYMRFSSGFGNNAGGGPGFGPGIQIAPPRRVHGPVPGVGTVLPPPPVGRAGRGNGGVPDVYTDDIERILKPMGAQIMSITSPEAFRKSVAALVEEISATD